MQQMSVKFMPWLLTDELKQQCVFVCLELMDEGRNDQKFLLSIITGVKTWVYCYEL